MTVVQPRFRSELRMGVRPAAAVVLIASLLMVWWGTSTRALLGLAFCAALAWLLNLWSAVLAKALLVAALVAAVMLAHVMLGIPGVLALLAIPTALAAALISVPAAAGLAAIESLLLAAPLAALPFPFASLPTIFDPPATAAFVALLAVWSAVGVMALAYFPMDNFARWAEDYYRRVQAQVEEALERKVALEQALEDLTQVTRQLALSNERLAGLRNIAEEAQQTKAAFVAKVSHEFRTPLNMIIGLVDLMVKSPEVYGKKLPRAMLEDLAIVQRNCEHLAGLVNDVLDLSQVEAGRLTLHRERVALPQVAEEALAVVRPLLAKKNLDLRVEMADGLPEVYCDRTRIRQVILNLLSNAARFTEQGRVSLAIEPRASSVVITVSDTGPGIPPDDIERIFEPFCQGTQPLWRDKGGSGLGLSISKQFVELHGGRIWLESELGAGTAFHFELPISDELAPGSRPTSWLSEDWIWHTRQRPAAIPDLAGKPRLLACDGTGALQGLLSRYAEEMEIVEAADLDEAAAAIRECPAHLAVFSATSGAELWPLLDAARRALPSTPVTGCLLPLPAPRPRSGDLLAYLVKPITQADLRRVLERAGLLPARPARPGRILLVDDDPDVIMLWTRMLRLLDPRFELRSEADGKEALAALIDFRPDLVLLDIILPGLDGWQVLAAKSEDPAVAAIPVVLVTAQDPADEPARSSGLMVTMDRGLSIGKLLRCSVAASAIILGPD